MDSGVGGELAQPVAEPRVGEKSAHERLQAGVRELAAQELEEAVQLVRVAAQRRRQLRGVLSLGRLERADVELEAVAGLVHPSQNPHGGPPAEPGIKQLPL